MGVVSKIVLVTAILFGLPNTIVAQSTIRSAPANEHLIDSYIAQISYQDLFNSSGSALSQPWQVLRQDRANFHRFGLRDPFDSGDGFFGRESNRAVMEAMLAYGSITGQAARDIMSGDAMVLVEIYGRGSEGHSVHVTVAR